MGEDSFSLLLAFDTDDPEFARGVEVGRLWEQLKTRERICETIHASNTEMAIRMCEALEREFHAHSLDDRWTDLTVEAA